MTSHNGACYCGAIESKSVASQTHGFLPPPLLLLLVR